MTEECDLCGYEYPAEEMEENYHYGYLCSICAEDIRELEDDYDY